MILDKKTQGKRLKLNKVSNQDQAEDSDSIETNSEQKNSLFQNKVNRRNLLSVIVIWSCSGFMVYLIMYYSKYFDGNFYLNYSI